MLADLRDATRQLGKAPGFTATALITLALGIGATTAIFTLVHQVMLKSLPVTKPGELWRVGDKDRCCNWGGYTQGGLQRAARGGRKSGESEFLPSDDSGKFDGAHLTQFCPGSRDRCGAQRSD